MEVTNKENMMYGILSCVSSEDAPIVFKGGLITKLILEENKCYIGGRQTKDIDANWVGEPPSMQSIIDTLNSALGKLDGQLRAEAYREYDLESGRSAGINLVDANGQTVVSIDMDIKPFSQNTTYYYGDTSIKGVLADEIIADKVSSVSSEAVYKHRCKDIVDLYALAHCTEINTTNIAEACERNHRTIKDFDGFLNHKDEIEHAYNKLKNIRSKPEFEEVYSYLDNFLQPYISKDLSEKVWKPSQSNWIEERTHESLGSQIKKLCDSRNITPETLAKAIGVKPNVMKNIIGDARIPSPSTVSKIADYFHISKKALNVPTEHSTNAPQKPKKTDYGDT